MKVMLVNQVAIVDRNHAGNVLSTYHANLFIDGKYTHVMIRGGDLYRPAVVNHDTLGYFTFVEIGIPIKGFVSPFQMMMAHVRAFINHT